MTKDELLRHLEDREDNYTERKLEGAAHQDEIRKAMVAFANSLPPERTAILFIGVADDGKVTGVKNSDALQKTVRQAAENCYPPVVRYSSEVLDLGGAVVVAVIIEASDNRPHFSGPAYVRKGSESTTASPELYEELIASRNTKAGIILRHKGKHVTIISRKILGSTTAMRDPMYKEKHEGIIVDCTAHVVTVGVVVRGMGERYQEPLERVRILADNPFTIEINE